jgi:hypothetical protein
VSDAIGPAELVPLEALSASFPTAAGALSEAAALRATLSLPKGTVHVVSDVHGEYKKLRHIINNASGSLRPLVESLFASRLSPDELQQLLAVLYYPRDLLEYLADELADAARRRAFVGRTLRLQIEVVRELARGQRRHRLRELTAPELRELFEVLLAEPTGGPGTAWADDVLDALAERDGDLDAVRAASHLVRNLSVQEIVVAGDLGDRGPRIDRVIEQLVQQPRVSITWGNHDASWMGACLGQEALIATVLRVSLRYRRLSQLEEGYGVIVTPLERLARTIYGDDPAERFQTRGTGLRDDLLMARMQKAAAVLQFKLEGQTSRRHPGWELEGRNLLHHIDPGAGTVEIDGVRHALLDTHLPTLDPSDPYALSPEERECMDRLRQSFLSSERLWKHMSFVVKRGAMWLVRDEALIFHGCVPVDADGKPLALEVDGAERRGRALFGAPRRRPPPRPRRAGRRLALVPVDGPRLAALRQGPHGDLRGLLRRGREGAGRDAQPLLQAHPRRGVLPRDRRGDGRLARRADRERSRARAGGPRGGAGQARRQRSDHRRRLLRGLRGPRLHPGAGTGAHQPGRAPPLRVGARRHHRWRRHRAQRLRGARARATAPHPRYRGGPRRRGARGGPGAAGGGLRPGPAPRVAAVGSGQLRRIGPRARSRGAC